MNTATSTTLAFEQELIATIDRLREELLNERRSNMDTRRALRKTIQDSTFTYRTKEYTIEVDLRVFNEFEWKTKKTRIYTSGSYFDAIEEPLREYYRPFGEEAPEYKAGRRVYRKAQKDMIMSALGKVGISCDKVTFSNKAGCSCPCSPGHIADDVLRYEGFKVETIYVRVTAN